MNYIVEYFDGRLFKTGSLKEAYRLIDSSYPEAFFTPGQSRKSSVDEFPQLSVLIEGHDIDVWHDATAAYTRYGTGKTPLAKISLK